MSTFNIYCPINDTGYGIVSRNIIKHLNLNGADTFHLSPIGGVQTKDQEEINNLNKHISYLWNRSSPSVAIWHEFDLNKFSSNILIPFPIFETNKFNTTTMNYLNQMDFIFVLSSWAKEIIEANTNKTSKEIFVIPGASDILEDDHMNTFQKNNVFTFCSVGKFEKRKAHLELMKAYIEVFSSKTEDTRLILHCFNPFYKNFEQIIYNVLNQLGLQVMHNSTMSSDSIIANKGNAIIEIPKTFLLKQQIFQLYKYSHIGVFPSRGEGWNLPLMEAIKMGTPCIASNYSAHTEYCNSEYNYPKELLLNRYKMETAIDQVWFRGDRGEWASPNFNELKDTLLYSYENYDTIISNFDNSKIKETFTWNNTASSFLKALDDINDKTGRTK